MEQIDEREIKMQIKSLQIVPNFMDLKILGRCFYLECSNPDKWEAYLENLKKTIGDSNHTVLSKTVKELFDMKKSNIIEFSKIFYREQLKYDILVISEIDKITDESRSMIFDLSVRYIKNSIVILQGSDSFDIYSFFGKKKFNTYISILNI